MSEKRNIQQISENGHGNVEKSFFLSLSSLHSGHVSSRILIMSSRKFALEIVYAKLYLPSVVKSKLKPSHEKELVKKCHEMI